MGGLFSKSDNSHGPKSKILHNISCSKCGKLFTKKNTYIDLYNHEITCVEKSESNNRIINPPHIDKNDRNIIKNIIAENKRKKSLKNNSNNSQFIEKESSTTSLETIGISKSMIPTDSSNTNNIITRFQNKKHSQYLSSNNHGINSFFTNMDKDHEMFFTSDAGDIERININSNFQIPKSFPKTKKLSLSSIETISDLNSVYLKDFPFEEKLTQFKKYLQSLKIDWREGACTINLERDDILSQSMKQFDHIDPYKELKINFKGEVSHDAGGLIREWFTVIFKELQKESLGKINSN
jgi:hypothetical protein